VGECVGTFAFRVSRPAADRMVPSPVLEPAPVMGTWM
jgi:hypothetical protein